MYVMIMIYSSIYSYDIKFWGNRFQNSYDLLKQQQIGFI